ncbi:MAG: hypothetical protein NVS1B13_02220 [Flavisolibacter sp.]
MKLKERLFSNTFSRNIFTDLGFRSNDSIPKNENLFFQYRIGKYQQDYYLYFPKEPLEVQYKNEIFNKIREYSGYEISRYLSFHFDAFENKNQFLEFLKYEIEERFKLNVSKKFNSRLILVQKWIEEKGLTVAAPQKSLSKRGQTGDHNEFDSDDYSRRLESILATAEEKMEVLSKTYNPGNIELVNSANNTKLIQLFILLRDLKTTYKKGVSQEQLFKSFSSSDIASLLQQHFIHFQNKKINTVQKEITAVNAEIDNHQEGIRKLNKALIEFFFEK